MMVYTRQLLMIMLLLVLAPVASAQSADPEFAPAGPDVPSTVPIVWKQVTLVLTGGWEYAGATIAWVGGGAALRLWRPDGATKTMAPDDILKVYDKGGRDITADVVARRYLGLQPGLDEDVDISLPGSAGSAWTVESKPKGPPQPPLFRFAADAGLGYATHAGSWFGGLDDGLNYQFGLRFASNSDLYFRALYRHQDLGQQTADIYIDGLGDTSLTITFALREYQFLLGTIGRVIEKQSLRSAGYLESGLSIMDHRAATDDFGGSSESITKVGLVLQGGVLFLLDKHLFFDLSAGVTWKSGLVDDEGGGLLMGAHAGLGGRY